MSNAVNNEFGMFVCPDGDPGLPSVPANASSNRFAPVVLTCVKSTFAAADAEAFPDVVSTNGSTVEAPRTAVTDPTARWFVVHDTEYDAGSVPAFVTRRENVQIAALPVFVVTDRSAAHVPPPDTPIPVAVLIVTTWAMRTSPFANPAGRAIVNDAEFVAVFDPVVVATTDGTAGAAGVAVTEADHALSPAAFDARTWNSYTVPFVNPITVRAVPVTTGSDVHTPDPFVRHCTV